MFTITFTGSRPKNLYGYGHTAIQRYDQLRSRIADTILELSGTQETRIITGGAQGADMLAFAAARDAARAGAAIGENDVYIPFPGQDIYWQEHGAFGRDAFREMLACADKVVDCSKDAPDNVTSKQLYAHRNQAMVDAADVVCAIVPKDFDPDGASGTAMTVNMAARAGKPVVTIEA